MIPRFAKSRVEAALSQEAAVALLGPRQVGKTTLALEIAKTRPAVYLDLERRSDREKLNDAETYLRMHADKLVVLDEIHRLPELFECLRGLIDEGRRKGSDCGQFLLLGSAGIELLSQSETLAGRIAYVELEPILAGEIGSESSLENLWLRGGYPRSLLAADDEQSLFRRENFIRSYLERDVPMFGLRIPAATLERLWTMLAHNQGSLLNSARLAGNLGLSSRTVNSYIDLLVDLLLLRRLPPWRANIGKRLVKSPKTYVRDCGLLHALLNIGDVDSLLGNPVVGASWEGFVIENLLAVAPSRMLASFFRTARGAEVDLILDMGAKHGVWAIEIKRSPATAVSKGFIIALQDLQPDRAFLVHGGQDRYPKRKDIEAVGLLELVNELKNLN